MLSPRTAACSLLGTPRHTLLCAAPGYSDMTRTFIGTSDSLLKQAPMVMMMQASSSKDTSKSKCLVSYYIGVVVCDEGLCDEVT
jgi:hypothetical protein